MSHAAHIGQWVHAAAARQGDKRALRAGDGDIDYAALARLVDGVEGALVAAGVGPGARESERAVVAWLGTNSAAMLATLFACARRGVIFMPLNWRLAPPEHRAQLAAVAPALFIIDGEFVAACHEQQVAPPATRCIARSTAAPAGWTGWEAFLAGGRAGANRQSKHAAATPDPEAPVLLCFTSGATGTPKGALLSARALAANADAADDMHGLVAGDHVLTTLPLFHVGGLNIQTLPALRRGCTVTLHAKFDAEATFDALERDGITLTVLVPAQLEVLLAHARWANAAFNHLRSISTGSTIVPRRLIDAVHARGVPLIQVWGATETGPVVCCLHADEAHARAGSAGRAAVGAELRIADAAGNTLPNGAGGTSGEVLVRAPQLMSGYWRDAAGTAQALAGGWFRSGDAGHLDADGYLWIDGRLKDMIICGGENVSPAEVEAVLLECPEVAEAAVVGRPDARWGEAVVAFVVPKEGTRPDSAQLLERFAGRLARFKHPRELIFVETLPRTALGKVQKDALRQLVAGRSQGPRA